MTDELRLLRAVAEASGDLRNTTNSTSRALENAFDALTAYRAQPKGAEPDAVMVRAVVLMSPCGEFWTVMGANDWDDMQAEHGADEIALSAEVRAAIIVAHVRPPTTPVVTGSVET